MKPLNEKQQKVLAFVKDRLGDGIPPSVREICDATGIKSTSTVHAYLKRLEDEGYIDRRSGLNRAIRLPGESVTRVPLLGKVTAGLPILAVEEVEDYVPFSGGSQYPAGELFALRVSGTSMINAGIHSDDLVVVRPQQNADDGQIVVARIEDEATVKRLHRRDGEIWLMPENENYAPIDGTHAEIIGIVKALIREY